MHLTQPTVLVQNRMGKELGFEFLDFNTTKRENMIHKQTQTKLTNHNNFTLSQLTHTHYKYWMLNAPSSPFGNSTLGALLFSNTVLLPRFFLEED